MTGNVLKQYRSTVGRVVLGAATLSGPVVTHGETIPVRARMETAQKGFLSTH